MGLIRTFTFEGAKEWRTYALFLIFHKKHQQLVRIFLPIDSEVGHYGWGDEGVTHGLVNFERGLLKKLGM